MQIIEHLHSSDGSSEKYVVKSSRGYMEFTKIFNESPAKRTIICAPVAYGCGLGCTFCHLTIGGSKNNKPITSAELLEGLALIPRDESIPTLISLMGAGEPLLNFELVEKVVEHFPTSLATSLPTEISVQRLIDYIETSPEKNLKIYASAHSFIPEQRKQLMPNSIENLFYWINKLNNLPSLTTTVGHKNEGKNRLTLHYTVIPGVNDTEADLEAYISFVSKLTLPVAIKFLSWSDGDNKEASEVFMKINTAGKVKTKYHKPNGSDLQGACGQFNPEYYKGI